MSPTILLIISTLVAVSYGRRNINPLPPPGTDGQMLVTADGEVMLSQPEGELLRFPDIFTQTDRFLTQQLRFTQTEVAEARQELIDMFVGTFPGEPLDVPSLEADGSIEIIPYMISNRLNTKTHLATNPCFTPAAGYDTAEGGFRLRITDPIGVAVDGGLSAVISNSAFYLSWFVLKGVRRNVKDCPGVVRGRTGAARSLITRLTQRNTAGRTQGANLSSRGNNNNRSNPKTGGRRRAGRRRGPSKPARRNYNQNRSRRPAAGNRGGPQVRPASSVYIEGLPPRDIIVKYKTTIPAQLSNSSFVGKIEVIESNYEPFNFGVGLVVDGVPKSTSAGLLNIQRFTHIVFGEGVFPEPL